MTAPAPSVDTADHEPPPEAVVEACERLIGKVPMDTCPSERAWVDAILTDEQCRADAALVAEYQSARGLSRT